ncbi:hypothetical protein [Nocardia sp. NPDC056000]|uniref:hypothetical protein n=1 Tax=Nocardia sp. NPDC056000 TaxID=3345674 RepID=UPI0035D5E898
MALRDLIARAVAIGATPGVPASEAELAAAEQRLGVRFDGQYRELMAMCSGIEGLGSWLLYPVSELGGSQRWGASAEFLVGEYFHPADKPFLNGDRVGGESVPGRFHPAPAGRTHTLIGENIDLAGSLVTNFPVADVASDSDVAYCRWEPEVFGNLLDTLHTVIGEAESRDDDSDDLPPEQWDRAGSSEALIELQRGISLALPAVIRHRLSARCRGEFDDSPADEAVDRLRKLMWLGGIVPEFSYTAITFDLWGPGRPRLRAMASFPEASGLADREAIVGVTKEDTLWRVDSFSWAE